MHPFAHGIDGLESLVVDRTKQRRRDVLAQADSRFEIYAGTQLRKINVPCRVLKMLDKIMVVRQMIPAASCSCPKSLQTPIHANVLASVSRLLFRCRRSSLCSLLPTASDHDHRQKRANNG